MEKRLWPVALVLLVALVALPVLLASGGAAPASSAASGSTGAVGALAPSAMRAQVTLRPALPVRRNRGGTRRNPFKVSGAAAESTKPATPIADLGGAASSAATTPSAAATPSQGSGATTPAAADPAPATTSPQAPAPTKVPATKEPAATDNYTIKASMGLSDAPRTAQDLSRLAPLPTADAPFLVFIGVLADKKTAVFLLSSDVTATGDGICRPSKASCQTIELRAGDAELLEVARDDGTTQSYDLDLVRVIKGTASTAAAAATADPAGTAVKAAAADARTPESSSTPQDDPVAGADGYRLDEKTGLLRRKALWAGAGAFARLAPGATAGFGLLAPAAPQP